MPARKKYNRRRRRNYRKKSYSNFKNSRSKRNRGIVNSLTVRGPTAIPDVYNCRLKYTDTFQINTAAVTNDQIFRGNGLFDPDQSGLGHQPRYYDQLSVLYNRYRVMASKIRVDIVGANSTGADLSAVALIPNLTSTSIIDIDDFGETPYAKYRMFSLGNASRPTILTNYAKTREFKTFDTQDDTLSASVGTVPVAQWFWHFVVGNVAENVSVDFTAMVTITYYCQFFERITPGKS